MKVTPNHNCYDVIISGAGPVGLFLACELALAKCTVLILEKTADSYSPLKQLPFGIRGLNAPSIAALDRRSLLQELDLHKSVKSPHTTPGARQAGHFAGIPFYDSDIDTSQWSNHLPGAAPTSLISAMAELETVLTRRAETLGVMIRRGLPVTGLQQTTTAVSVQIDDQSFNAKWLVGCDGSRSVVRKMGGFLFEGTEPEFTGYNALVELTDPEQLKPGRNVTANGMYLQSQPGYIIMQDFDSGAFHQSNQPITQEHLQEVLRRISNTNVIISGLHTATTWTDRTRQATAYRNGRVFLAGDAAHIHSPLGGQGLNLGIGDAVNLGWKLAATIHGAAADGLLDSYFNERHPVGEQVLNWSRAQVTIMKPDPGALAMHAITRELMKTRDGATYFSGRVWGVSTRYDLGNSHPLIGCSVPNFTFADGTTIADLMYHGRGILLDFDESALPKTLAEAYGDQIKYISGQVNNRLGLSSLLIRPDGIVAWAANDNSFDRTQFEQAANRWFTKMR